LRRAYIVIILVTLVSPIFGVFLAELVGYHEPLDMAAEALNLRDLSEELNWTPLIDYTVPGLPDAVGYVVAGLIGIAITTLLGYALVRLL
jgi:cobalt/nickel transport protein